MIVIAATGTTDRTAHHLHTKRQVLAVKSLLETAGDCCWCTCDTIIPAFAYLDDETDRFRNDYFSWLIKVPTNCTVTGTLTNLDTGTDYVITDNTYGLLYGVDVLKDNVWGFIIKWSSVADGIDFGNYKFNITVEDGSSNELYNKDVNKFRLMPYTCDNAHGTVRIETWNTGYIEGGFDYRNITIDNQFGGLVRGFAGWFQQIRWYGKLNITAHPTNIDNIYDNYRDLKQVQTQIQNEWNLRLDFIPMNIGSKVIYDNLLGDYLYLSDYNANNVDDYNQV